VYSTRILNLLYFGVIIESVVSLPTRFLPYWVVSFTGLKKNVGTQFFFVFSQIRKFLGLIPQSQIRKFVMINPQLSLVSQSANRNPQICKEDPHWFASNIFLHFEIRKAKSPL
jgi:hypothetical protein